VSRRRSIALVAAVVGLLAVVAVAALGRPLGQSRGPGSGLPTTFWGYVLTTLVIVLALGAISGFVALFFFRIDRPGMEFARTRPLRSIIVMIVVSALIFFIGRHLDFLHHLLARHKTPKPGQGGSKPVKVGGQPVSSVHFEWPEAVVVAGVLLAALLVYNRRWRVLVRPLRPHAGAAPEELMAALDESLDDLRGDSDLRRAIVAAYARMERALAAAGVPRDPAETPLEYLERVLLSLDASGGAVRRLTDLFEWARFSHHEPEPPMRDEAVDALVAVRDELRATAPMETS
jgi:hypothetical protein